MLRIAAAAIAIGLVTTSAAVAAAFPGKNGQIVFQRSGEIVVVNADGSGERVISQGTANRDPALSPDGLMVAYESGRDLVVTPVAGGATRNVTTGGKNDQFPAFSPDGKRIVFHRADDTDLYIVNVDGSGLVRLTKDGNEYAEYEPEWSPDASKIAFERPGCDKPAEGQVCVFVINADGSGLTNLTPEEFPAECPNVNPGVGPRGNSSNPTWSPDGSKIAYTGTAFHCQEASGNIAGGDIWVMNADGSGKRDITPDANDRTYDAQPSWSPDGQQIAFQSDRLNGGNAGPVDILVMPAAGLAAGPAVKVVSVGAGQDPQPNWAPKPIAIIGTDGADVLNGTNAADIMFGLKGNDVINGFNGNDIISGGDGRDNVKGGAGNDKLDGGAGNDKLDGGKGRNTYKAGAGNDIVTARNGKKDTVDCGAGRDSVTADRSDRLKRCEKIKRAG